MGDVRILSYNIKNFKRGVIEDTSRATRLMQVLYTGGNRNYDIFVIIEGFLGQAHVANVGEYRTDGAGPIGVQILFHLLYNRDNAWRVAPLRAAGTASTKEIYPVFYHTGTVILRGPENDGALPVMAALANPATIASIAPIIGGGLPVVTPWAPPDTGRIRYHPINVATAATSGNEVTFPDPGSRRPYLVKFRDVASANDFYLVAFHAPPDSRYPFNAQGVDHLGRILEITSSRGGDAAVVVGDFNCCTYSLCTTHAADEVNAQESLAGNLATSYRHVKPALDAVRASVAALHAAIDAYRAAAQTNAAGTMIAAAVPAGTAVTQARAAGAAADRGADAKNAQDNTSALIGLARAAALTANGTALTPMVPSFPPGADLTQIKADATVASDNATGARDAALAISDTFDTATVAFVESMAKAVRQASVTFDEEVARANKANGVIAARAVGQHVTDAITELQNLGGAAAVRLTATGSANAARGATNADDCTALALAAVDNMLPVAAKLFMSQIHNTRTSMRTTSTASAGNYTLHAYDHVLTIGFVSVRDAAMVDLVDKDYRALPPPVAPPTFLGMYRRLFTPNAGSSIQGLSDHLPVTVTVTL